MLLSVCEFIIFLEIITTSNFFGVIFSTLCKELYVFLQLFSLCLSLTLFFPQLCSLLFFCHAYDDSGWTFYVLDLARESRVCGSFVSELWGLTTRSVEGLGGRKKMLINFLCWLSWTATSFVWRLTRMVGCRWKRGAERRARKARNSNGNSTKSCTHDGRLSSSLGFFFLVFSLSIFFLRWLICFLAAAGLGQGRWGFLLRFNSLSLSLASYFFDSYFIFFLFIFQRWEKKNFTLHFFFLRTFFFFSLFEGEWLGLSVKCPTFFR